MLLSTLLALTWAAVACASSTRITTTSKTAVCYTDFGPTKVRPVPRTTTISITHSHTTTTSTKTVAATTYPTTCVTTTVTDTTTTTSMTCATADLQAKHVNVNAASRTLFPTAISCTKMVTLLTETIHFTTTTVTTTGATITSTETATTTSTSVEYTSSPDPEGAQYAIYYNDQGPDENDTYSQFDPAVYKTETPAYNDVTYEIGGIYYGYDYETFISIYGSSYEFANVNFTLNHKFYLVAQEEGYYYFSIQGRDDIVLVWIGDTAQSGWTRENADMFASTGTDSDPLPLCLSSGQYMPIRIVMAQAIGPVALGMSIISPYGYELIDDYAGPSPYIVQYSCNADNDAGPFPPWGNE